MLKELHRGHPGIVRMKVLARSHVWWPDIDREIGQCASSCQSCQAVKNSSVRAPLHPWVWPTNPWERVYLDFAGPFLGKMILVAVDAHTKWPEAYFMHSTTTTKTITILCDMFARYGLPRQIVTDNGPQFVSEEFQRFMSANGIKHVRCSPYHPASNGAAERLVQTVKKALRAGHLSGESLDHSLAAFLLKYRITPHATTGVAPCTLMFGREIHTHLSLLSPNIGDRVRDQQQRQKEYHDKCSRAREFRIGDSVWARNLHDGPRWLKAVVSDRLGPVSYLIQLKNGDYWRRHVDHLRTGSDPEAKPTEKEPSCSPHCRRFQTICHLNRVQVH